MDFLFTKMYYKNHVDNSGTSTSTFFDDDLIIIDYQSHPHCFDKFSHNYMRPIKTQWEPNNKQIYTYTGWE